MINRFFIACFMFIGMCVSSYAQKTVFVSDFGAIPNDNKDDAVALRKAAEYVRNNEGTVLVFSPGTYILHDDKAVELENTVMVRIPRGKCSFLITTMCEDLILQGQKMLR